LGIKNLNRLIFLINNWLDIVEVACDGTMKLKYMLDFVAYVATMIGEHHKFIEEKGLLKKITMNLTRLCFQSNLFLYFVLSL